MKRMSWEARAAKREIAEFALRKAIEHIEATKIAGGATSVPNTWFVRAMHLARAADRELRLSEGQDKE